MSRVGGKPVDLPSGVDVKIDGSAVSVKGSKGELNRMFHERIGFDVDEGVVTVTRPDDTRESRALHGLSRALLHNMVVGVSDGFRKELEIQGVGYRASLKGKDIELLVGFSHPVLVEAPEGITFEVPEQTRIIVSGIDKELVGQVAANIRKVRPPEPYKGKGIRYVGEYVRRKAGKAGK
ncbi:MAG TPA: 50S ribosomal protein L6 [Acidimicrobiia bacterium]|nr:50S ribosomal protein L6 [Acidimicrobiia bacterium]